MADYLKGTVTEAYMRCMNQNFGIMVTEGLDVRAIAYLDPGSGADLHIYDKYGDNDTALEAALSWSGLSTAEKNAFVFVNPGDPDTVNNPSGTAITIEPWEELSELSPELSIAWDEFDAIGTSVMQKIPIRKEFTISYTQKAVDGKWEAIQFGDYSGNFAHHGVHEVGGVPTLTCFEGRNELGTDIGFQVNIVMGQQTGRRWVVLRAKNLCMHACSDEISPAAITNRTIEFSGNHGYYYTVANVVTPGQPDRPDLTELHWSLADGS